MTAATTGYDKTSGTVRFKSADETTVDTANRLQIPSGADIFSYTKQLRFYFSSGPSVDIQNLRAYSDGANGMGTGIAVKYDTQTSFQTQTDGTIGGTDIFTKTSGAVIDLDTYNTGPHTGTGYKGDFLRLQMGISNTASSGALSAETLTMAYDET
jgi:hypothetical protein